jgi:thiamine pyrophosphate-dependent acetolactate synthase large subunit-like protein
MAAAYDIEGESVSDPQQLGPALERCKRAMQEGRPYLVDARIMRYHRGADSGAEYFSIARG